MDRRNQELQQPRASRDKQSERPPEQTARQFLHQISALQRQSKMASKEKEKDPEEDINYIVYIKLPFNRGDFVDPPPVGFAL